MPHQGVSATRNALLDFSTAEYVMWCDADDMFCSAFGLYLILQQIKSNPFKVLISLFYEELIVDGTHYFIERKQDRVFVHGKAYNRQWLIDTNIRWNDKLTVHEDSYFNYLAQTMAEQISYCNIPFYLWKWRDDSVVRKDNKLMLKTYNNLIDSGDALIEEMFKRDRPADADKFICFNIFDAYYVMNKPEWINLENIEYREKTELHFANFYKKYKERWDAVSDDVKAQSSVAIRNKYVKEGMQMESLTITQWLEKILEKVK